jgi:heptosyltransferase-2
MSGFQFPFPSMDKLLTIVSRGGNGLAEGVRQQQLLLACGLLDEINFLNEEFRTVDSAIEMGNSVDLKPFMARIGLSLDKPFILLAPSASHPTRRWPADRFAELAKRLYGTNGVEVLTIGGASDRALGEKIEVLSCGIARNLVNRTTLLETIALIGQAKLLITNDSGPAHIGGSVGTPTLVLSACPKTSLEEHPSSPQRVRPVGPRVLVLQPDTPAEGCGKEWCSKPFAHCIEGISIDAAEKAALSLYRKVNMQKAAVL